MNASNLPPGVSVNDIPGNRPEDVAEEKFWEEVDAKFAETMPNYAEIMDVVYETTGLGVVALHLNAKNMLLEEVIGGYATVARDLGYARGYADARSHEDEHQSIELLDRFYAAGWRIADDGDPYKPED